MPVPALVFLLACCALPSVLAGAPAPVEGEVVFHEPPALHADVEAWATHGALDLSASAAQAEVGWSRAHGRTVRTNWTQVGEGAAGLSRVTLEPPHVEDLSWGEATLRVEACGPACLVLLVADGRGEVGVGGIAAGATAWRAEPRSYCGGMCDNDRPSHVSWTSPRGDLLVGAAPPGEPPALPLEDAAPRASGGLRLIVQDAVVVVEAADGRRREVDLLARADGPTLLGSGRYQRTFLVLDLGEAAVRLPAGAPALFMAADPVLRVRGNLSSPSASGVVSSGGASRAFDREPLRVDGDVVLALLPPGDAPLLPARVEPRAELSGEASEVVVGAHVLAAPAAASGAARAGAAGLLALLLALSRGMLAPLYSRIPVDRVLAHPRRARILALLRASPGLTERELAAGIGASRIVVKHHLALLLAHRFVRRQVVARASRYAAVDEAIDERDVHARAALQDATRRRVAAALVEGGPASQRDLVARAGVSQRLVSHHLARLRGADLVQVEPGVPQTYRATARLVDLLRG